MTKPKTFSKPTQEALLKRAWGGPMVVGAKKVLGRTPLMVAARMVHVSDFPDDPPLKPDIELVRRLLEEGCDILEENNAGNTVWSFCADFKTLPFLLLENWPDTHHLNRHGECFLHELLADDDIFEYMEASEVDAFLETMLLVLLKDHVDLFRKNDKGKNLVDVLCQNCNWSRAEVDACIAKFEQTQLSQSLSESSLKSPSKVRL